MKFLIGGILFFLFIIGAVMVGTIISLMLAIGFIGQGVAWICDQFLTRSGIDAWGQRLLIRQGIV